jgi:ATP-binding cassette subfamily F protein uup
MTNPNFLILDEPTNDLDIQTLSVLETFLLDFSGCVLAVSHDRYFLDRVVDYLFVLDGSGEVSGFPSGCSDWLEWKKVNERQEEKARREARDKEALVVEAPAPLKRKRSFKENREYEAIIDEIASLESEKALLEILFASGTGNSDAMKEAGARYKTLGELIPVKELRWEELASLD